MWDYSAMMEICERFTSTMTFIWASFIFLLDVRVCIEWYDDGPYADGQLIRLLAFYQLRIDSISV